MKLIVSFLQIFYVNFFLSLSRNMECVCLSDIYLFSRESVIRDFYIFNSTNYLQSDKERRLPPSGAADVPADLVWCHHL